MQISAFIVSNKFSNFLEFQSKPEIDSVVLLLAIIDAFDAYASVFIACELSQRISNAFEDIHKHFDQFDWYLYPNEIQQMLPTILNMLQQPLELVCFGSFSSSRMSFQKASAHIHSKHA